MKIGSYDHLPDRDKLAFIRLTIFIAGLEAVRNFEVKARDIINGVVGKTHE